MIRITAAAVVAAVLATASAASAQETRIAYGDLDLSTAAGAQQLDQRVEAAASNVCRNVRAADSRLRRRGSCEASARQEIRRQLPREAQEALNARTRTASL